MPDEKTNTPKVYAGQDLGGFEEKDGDNKKGGRS